jgi:predicted nucleic acid-binding Zn finger protein
LKNTPDLSRRVRDYWAKLGYALKTPERGLFFFVYIANTKNELLKFNYNTCDIRNKFVS